VQEHTRPPAVLRVTEGAEDNTAPPPRGSVRGNDRRAVLGHSVSVTWPRVCAGAACRPWGLVVGGRRCHCWRTRGIRRCWWQRAIFCAVAPACFFVMSPTGWDRAVRVPGAAARSRQSGSTCSGWERGVGTGIARGARDVLFSQTFFLTSGRARARDRARRHTEARRGGYTRPGRRGATTARDGPMVRY